MTALHAVFRRFTQILFVAAAAMPLPMLAQTTLWNTTADGNWTDPTKWTNGVPASNYNVGFQVFTPRGVGGGGGYTTEITYDYTGPSITLNNLSVPHNGPQTGQLTQDGNRLAALTESVFGVYQLSGSGINAVTNTLTLGGQYVLDTGGVSAGELDDGGTFTHISGGVTVTGLLALAHTTGAGVYSMVNGSLTAGSESVGEVGNGTFTQFGGTHVVNNVVGSSLLVGANVGSAGAFTLSAGSLTTQGTVVGNRGSGAFTQNNGSHTTPTLYLAYYPGAVGSYTLNGGTLSVSGSELIADDQGSVATFTQTLGNHSVGSLTIASGPAGSQGTYNLISGTLSVGTSEIVGNTGSGAFNQSGGAHTITGPLTIANGVGSSGSYALSAGNLSANSLTNNGAFTQTGGSLVVNGNLSNNNFMTLNGADSIAGTFANNGQAALTGGTVVLTSTAPSHVNNGILDLAPGFALNLGGAAVKFNNFGTMTLPGAAITGAGSFTNGGTGVFSGHGIISTGSFLNAGLLDIDSGTLRINPSFSNLAGGSIYLGAVTANLSGTGSTTLTNAGLIQGLGQVSITVNNNGTIEPVGGTLQFTGLSNNAAGLIRITSGNKVRAPMLDSAGTISLVGGTYDGIAALSNTGTIAGFGIFASPGLTNNGSITFTGGLTTVNGPVTNAPAKKIVVQYNPAIFTGPVTNNGTFQVISTTATFAGGFSGNPTSAPVPQFGAALVLSTGVLQAAYVRQNSLTLDGNVNIYPRAGGGDTSVLNSIAFNSSSARLDLADTALIVDYTGSSPLSMLRTKIIQGYNGGTWTGNGITSSSAAANPAKYALGYAEASDALGLSGANTADFQGQTADATSALVRLTVYGDANLDGVVNFIDLVKLAQNYNGPGEKSWGQGDFNFDGTVDFVDLVKLAQNYGGSFPTEPVASAFAAVPEPGATLLVVIAAYGLARRRWPNH
jgi:hypothetical protein